MLNSILNILPLENFTEYGMDRFSFLFSANKNQPVELIQKVASGGEMSRLMLSIKSLISESLDVPTLIFDEIDAGVSGEIADKMGKMLKEDSSETDRLSMLLIFLRLRAGVIITTRFLNMTRIKQHVQASDFSTPIIEFWKWQKCLVESS